MTEAQFWACTFAQLHALQPDLSEPAGAAVGGARQGTAEDLMALAAM